MCKKFQDKWIHSIPHSLLANREKLYYNDFLQSLV